jgi:hypothetical protein
MYIHYTQHESSAKLCDGVINESLKTTIRIASTLLLKKLIFNIPTRNKKRVIL